MSDSLHTISNALAETVAKTAPGVVRIEARRRIPASGTVWSSDGIIITANHVIERDDSIVVGLEDGTTMTAHLIGRDPGTDLAVLKTDEALPTAQWATSQGNTLQIGNLVLALGRPGADVQAALGIVRQQQDGSQPFKPHSPRPHGPRKGFMGGGGPRGRWGKPERKGPPWSRGGFMMAQLAPVIHADLTMYPGFSGGPLVDTSGQIHGINTSALARSGALTIPTATVQRVAEALLTDGKVKRGYLGISTQPVRLPQAFSEETGQDGGLMVISVEADSAAARSGLMMGDVLVSLDDYPLESVPALMHLLSAERVGQQSTLRLIRGGVLLEQSITIPERP